MKIWEALFLCFLTCSLLKAQSIPWLPGVEIPKPLEAANLSLNSSPTYLNASEFEGGLLRFWPLKFGSQPTDTSILYALVSFDTLIGPSTSGAAPSAFTDLEIDLVRPLDPVKHRTPQLFLDLSRPQTQVQPDGGKLNPCPQIGPIPQVGRAVRVRDHHLPLS